MSTATLSRPLAIVEADVDWEASAGAGDVATARIDRPPYIYVGTAEPHWLGQPCRPLVDAHIDALVECQVAFACGCWAVVPAAVLVLYQELHAGELAQRAP
jgi:hypothetical protein